MFVDGLCLCCGVAVEVLGLLRTGALGTARQLRWRQAGAVSQQRQGGHGEAVKCCAALRALRTSPVLR